ncbi:MAG: AraC family transcriptional regulator [Burkholderiales bacterium]|nr:AraC family transcriptional regulator [Burkholderiales bacterium]
MNPTDFDAYRRERLAEGFDEVAERVWAPDTIVEVHTHPFAVEARVVQGEMWLTVGAATRHLLPGDRFELARAQPHAERYGPAGATYWAARRHG